MKKAWIIKTSLVLTLFICSCDNLLDQEPENSVTIANYWTNEKEVESAVFGIHTLFRFTFSDALTLFRDCRGNIFDAYTAAGTLYNYFSQNKYNLLYPNANSSSIYDWGNIYKLIAQCNFVIDNVHRANLPQDRHNFYMGQALTIRAYAYFYLVRYWGDAPLITRSGDTGPRARQPWQEIADFAINDALQATALLPSQNDMVDASERPIISKQVPGRGTAWAILAHLYAWKANLNNEPALLEKGIEAATHVIEDGDYQLVPAAKICTDLSYGNSTEGILELDYRKTAGDLSSSGNYMAGICESYPIIPLAVIGGIRTKAAGITNALAMSLFPDVTDQRRKEYFYELDMMAATQPVSVSGGRAYIQKWRGVITYASGSSQGTLQAFEDNFILIRLADIILLRAEMLNQSGKPQEAINDLNVIRNRALAKVYDAAIEGTDLKAVIFREREKELFLDPSRYFDAIRNGNDYVRSKFRGDFKTLTDQDIADGALYLPVYSAAFENNLLMRQNQYWKMKGVN